MLELLQFRHSPYNEKVRWVLDVKHVPHRRRSLLPGPHLLTVRRQTGRTTTPVLLHEGGALDGSARIVAWLEARHPLPAVFPPDEPSRIEALRIERWFDEDITPRIRRVVLDTLLRTPSYFARVFGDGASVWRQRTYALTVPLAAPIVRRGNGIAGPDTVADGLAAMGEALDVVADRAAATGYLLGDDLTIADIAAASSLAMLVRPPQSPMASVEPVSPAFAMVVRQFADHAGAAWVRSIYRRHRLARADFDGPSAGVA